MTQIIWRLGAGAGTTSQQQHAATTSGPIKIPNWAPDIAYIPTTTINGMPAGLVATTTIGTGSFALMLGFNPGDYNSRCLNVKNVAWENSFAAGNYVILEYRAVGELVRS